MTVEHNFSLPFAATARHPLMGVTLLLVEDSRTTGEAIRLLCVRSGARIRRADCIESAKRHLGSYVPSVILVDMGLPDGSGAEFIIHAANALPARTIILGLSGEASFRPMALNAGAVGFIEKPISSLAEFQSLILQHLPAQNQPKGPRGVDAAPICTDAQTLHEDLSHALNLLVDGDQTPQTRSYICTFLIGIARMVGDTALETAAQNFASAPKWFGPQQQVLQSTLNGRLRQQSSQLPPLHDVSGLRVNHAQG